MGDFEALGDAVTGGMLGRAVEPKAGEAGDGHTHEAQLPQLRRRADRPVLPRVRPARACPPHLARLLPRLPRTACSISKARSGAPCRCWHGSRASSPGATSTASAPASSRRSRCSCSRVFLMFAVIEPDRRARPGRATAAAERPPKAKHRRRQKNASPISKRIAAEAVAEHRPTATVDPGSRGTHRARRRCQTAAAAKQGKIDDQRRRRSERHAGLAQARVGKASANPELLFYKLQDQRL